MKRALLTLASLALLVTALWFGPRLIDWEAQRDRVALLAAQELGRPVAIQGPLRLTLLPRPLIEASDVLVGGGEGDIGVTARALRVTLALPALLTGRLDPREVVLIGADIRLPWPPGNAPALRPPPWLTSFDARIEESRILVGDTALEGVVARLTAGGAYDAVHAEGAFTWRGQALRFTAAIGRPGYDGIATFELALATPAGARALARGVLVEDGGFDGRIEMTGPDLAALLPAPALPFRAEGRLTVSAELLAADALTLELGGIPGRGALALRLAPTPRLDVALNTARLDLDAWSAALRAAPAPALVTAIDLAAEAASFRGVTLRRLRGAVVREAERITLTDVAATLPGEMAVDLAGASAGQRLELALRFTGPDAGATLASLGLPLEGLRLRSLEGRARLVVEDSQIAVPELAATLDGTRLAGSAVWRHGARPSLGLGLTLNALDLDALLQAPPDPTQLAARLAGFDATLRLAADSVTLRGQRIERASLDAALDGGRLALRRLAGRLAGADIALAGAMALTTPARVAELSLDVTAAQARGLLDHLPPAWQPGPGLAEQPLALRLQGSGPLDALALRLEADLGELRAEAQGTLDLPQSRIAGALTLRHPGAPRLLAALAPGAPMGWLGEGSFSLIANLLAGPAAISAESFELVAGQLRTRGALTLGLDAPLPRISGRLAAERLPLPDPPWRSAEAFSLGLLSRFQGEVALTARRIDAPDLPPIEEARAALRLAAGTLAITGIEGRLGGGRLGGEAMIEAAAGQAPRLRMALRLADAAITAPLLGLPIDITAGTLAEGSLALEAEGHSPAALAASLAGGLRISLRDGVLRGMDLAALQAAAAVEDAPEAGLRHALEAGQTGYERLDIAATITAGVARIEQAALSAGAAGLASAAGQVDLARGMLDIAIAARPGPAEAPEITLRLQGLAADPRRSLELADWLRWRATP